MEVSCKVGGASLDSFQLTFIRFVIGAAILLPFAIGHLRKHNIRLTARDHLSLAAAGVLGVTFSMSLFQIAIMMCNASTVSVLFCVNPFFTMAFAHFMTNEKLNRHKAWVLFCDYQNSPQGMGLMILAAFIFGFYTVFSKQSQQRFGLMAQTSISFLYGSAVLLILLLVTGRPIIDGLSESIPIVIYTGVLVTGLGYFCYFKAIELSDAATGAFAFFIKPVIAPIIAVIVLHETILWNTVVGILLILIASIINIYYQRKKSYEEIIHKRYTE